MKRRFIRFLSACAFAALIAISILAACEVAYRVHRGKWYFKERQASGRELIQPHPYFGACIVPNISVERNGIRISHNSFRTRGPEFGRPKPPGRTRIVALGGSSTYCVGVSDDETWPFHLNQQLGTNYEVINMGAPGGTSLETMLQSALLFSDVQPDIAVFYLGWNDARVQHVQGLRSDYSDFHGKWVMAHGLTGREMRSRTATGYIAGRMAFHYFFPQMDADVVAKSARGTADAFTDRVDARAISLYERNLELIVAICQKQGVRPVFIPQILNYEQLTADTSYGWLPFVRDRDLKTIMAAYNESLAKIARQENVGLITEVLEVTYTQADFVDNGHFSDAGNQRFAVALNAGLKRVLAATPTSASK